MFAKWSMSIIRGGKNCKSCVRKRNCGLSNNRRRQNTHKHSFISFRIYFTFYISCCELREMHAIDCVLDIFIYMCVCMVPWNERTYSYLFGWTCNAHNEKCLATTIESQLFLEPIGRACYNSTKKTCEKCRKGRNGEGRKRVQRIE